MTPEQQQLAITLLKATLGILEAMDKTNLYLYTQTVELLKEVDESKIEAQISEAFDRSFNDKVLNALKQA